MVSLTILGTACGYSRGGRGHASILVRQNGSHILLDAGEPCAGKLEQMGVPCERLDAVCISHAHADHTSGLPMIIQNCEGWKRERPLDIYLPNHLIIPLQTWLTGIALSQDRLSFRLNFHALGDAERFTQGNIDIVPFVTSHVKTPGCMSFGFVLEHGDGRILYTADLGSVDDLDKPLSKPSTIVISELAHIQPADLIEKLKGKKVGTLCLVHLAPELDEQALLIKRKFEDALPDVDAVFVPTDGETFSL